MTKTKTMFRLMIGDATYYYDSFEKLEDNFYDATREGCHVSVRGYELTETEETANDDPPEEELLLAYDPGDENELA